MRLMPGRRRRRAVAAVTGVLAGAALATMLEAQELEPRAYANTPVGLNFLLLGYGYVSGDIVTDPAVPLQDASVQSHTAALAYVRSLDVFGTSGKVGLVLPWSAANGTATLDGQPGERHVTGLGDPRLLFSLNLYGAPALTLDEFADYRQDTIVGVSLQVSIPIGSYDPDKLLNIGTNRWSFRPEIGVSRAVGPLTLELAAGATFFTRNDDFVGRTLDVKPLWAVQGHALYDFARNVWGALDVVYYRGGRVTLDGVESDQAQENLRVGGTLAVSVSRRHSIKLHGSTSAYSRTGTKFNLIGAAWQYRWGGGL